MLCLKALSAVNIFRHAHIDLFFYCESVLHGSKFVHAYARFSYRSKMMKAVYEYIHSWLDIKISNLFIDDQKEKKLRIGPL